MAALDLDVFRRCGLLFAAALPRDNAIATGIDCRARHRRRKLHGFAVGPVIDSASAQDFVEPPGVARLWLVGDPPAQRHHLPHPVRCSPRGPTRKAPPQAPPDQADRPVTPLSTLAQPRLAPPP